MIVHGSFLFDLVKDTERERKQTAGENVSILVIGKFSLLSYGLNKPREGVNQTMNECFNGRQESRGKGREGERGEKGVGAGG